MIQRITPLILASCCLAAAPVYAQGSSLRQGYDQQAGAAGKPHRDAIQPERDCNIVFIMADDLGYGDVGCYRVTASGAPREPRQRHGNVARRRERDARGGSEVSETPHIDALAASGLRFTDFHSSGPMCSPTRAATLTGQYQQRFGRKFDTALSGRDHRDSGLPREAVTIAEVLQKAGYASACFGKWHLGYQPPWMPPDQGFDEFRGLGSGDGDFHTHVDRSGNEDWWRGNELVPDVGYTTELLTRYSVDFIERHRDERFFLYVPHLAIHFPWQGPDDPPHRVAGKSYHDDKWGIVPDRSNVQPHVKAMIEALDESVGEIVAALRRWKLDRNTMVLFTSDNGGYLTYSGGFENISSNGPLRGQKGQLYEGGHRVPMIVSWPGKIEPGVTGEIAHSTDLFPTFAALTGVSVEGVTLDGVDLVPLLLEGASLPERMLFWRKGYARAVRSGPWKLCVTGRNTELFNLSEDIGEIHNLAGKYPERVKKLKAAWVDWEDDVNKSAKSYE